MNILFIALKHVVWRFQIYNYFRQVDQILPFLDGYIFREIIKAFIKSRNLIIRESNYTITDI